MSLVATGGIILLIASIVLLILIYFIARDNFSERLLTLRRIGVSGIPNPEFFKWVWYLFIFSACVGYYLVSGDWLVGFRWVGMLLLTFLSAYFLFGSAGFETWVFASITLFSLVILLGESIYTFGIVYQNRTATALLGFYFFWSIYALYLTVSVVYRFINASTFEWR